MRNMEFQTIDLDLKSNPEENEKNIVANPSELQEKFDAIADSIETKEYLEIKTRNLGKAGRISNSFMQFLAEASKQRNVA